MNTTKDELLLECIKQFKHIEDVLGYNRFSTTQSLINEIKQTLSEQLPESEKLYRKNNAKD